MGFVPELVVFVPIRLRNQIWDKYHFSGKQLWLRAHGSAEKNNRAWCARCMDNFERYWNICAKTACGRVHPVAVVTAASPSSQRLRRSCRHSAHLAPRRADDEGVLPSSSEEAISVFFCTCYVGHPLRPCTSRLRSSSAGDATKAACRGSVSINR